MASVGPWTECIQSALEILSMDLSWTETTSYGTLTLPWHAVPIPVFISEIKGRRGNTRYPVVLLNHSD
jgi:hypothetical protein